VTYDCSFGFTGLIAAISGGTIAGIIIIICICLIIAATTGSTAYAVSQSYIDTKETDVKQNPLYKPKGKTVDVPDLGGQTARSPRG